MPISILKGDFFIVTKNFYQKTEVPDFGSMWIAGYLCQEKTPCVKVGICGGRPGAFGCKAYQLLVLNSSEELRLARDVKGKVYRLEVNTTQIQSRRHKYGL